MQAERLVDGQPLQAPVLRAGGRPHIRWVSRAPLLGFAAVIMGGLLRLYHVNALSLWVDEGLSVAYSHLSWPVLLGLHGAYTPHPPLYFALVKVASLWLPDSLAGRAISVVAGTLTIAALYALVQRLAGAWIALVASVALALSPLAIWYSQEARPYALDVLLVCVSYLALITFYQTGRRQWIITYGVALVLAMYVEYSAFFALAPQALLFVLFHRCERSRTRASMGAAGATAVAFLPWLPHLFSYAGPTSEQAQFALSSDKVVGVLLAVMGLSGNGGYFLSTQLLPWDLWPGLRPLLLIFVVLPAVLGAGVLLRRSTTTFAVALCLFAGTIAIAAAVSIVYPSFIYRTLLCAVLGWVVLLAPGPVRGSSPRWIAVLAGLGLIATFILSGFADYAFYTGAYKQQFRLLAEDTALAATFGFPVLTYPSVTDTLVRVYRPHALDHGHASIGALGQLPDLSSPGGQPPAALWLAYPDGGYMQQAIAQLADRGYRRIMQTPYTGPLYLDLWALPNVRLGRDVKINGRFAGSGRVARGWALPARSLLISVGRQANRTLLVGNVPPGEDEAITTAPARAQQLFALSFRARDHLRSGMMRAFLICMSPAGAFLDVDPNGAGASIPNDGTWHQVMIAALCPRDTATIRVDLRNSGLGILGLKDVRLQQRLPR